jgi:hypothetical protein
MDGTSHYDFEREEPVSRIPRVTADLSEDWPEATFYNGTLTTVRDDSMKPGDFVALIGIFTVGVVGLAALILGT